MFLWLFHCLRNLITAIVALAGLIALTEVGLRVYRITQSDTAPSSVNSPASQPWSTPSDLTAFQMPRWQRFDVTTEHGPTHWTTNSWGHRGTDPICPKPTDYYRIVCLGDDALLAPSISDDALITQGLQRRLQSQSTRAIEVINAAIPQACPLTMAAQFRSQILALQPDLILIQLSSHSLSRDATLRRWMVRDTQGRILGCVHPATRGSQTFAKFAECRKEFALLDWGLTQLGQTTPENNRPAFQWEPNTPLDQNGILTAIQPCAEISTGSQALEIPCVVWCCPSVNSADVVAQHQFMVETITPALREYRIPTVDALQAITPAMLSEESGWTSTGHQQLADFLATQLLQNLAGPWSTSSPVNGIQPVQHSSGSTTEIPTIQRAVR